MSLETNNRHATIPVFVPHLACPHQCVFCNQKKISGQELPNDDLEKLDIYLKKSVAEISDRFSECEIAFFGGSFTGIPEPKMTGMLKTANKYIGNKVKGIRLSTRPDYISDHILDVLEEYNVTDIELGVQSFDDEVLLLSERGHTSAQTEKAIELIRKRKNIRLVLQLMPGLPGDNEQTIRHTIERAAEICPDGVRIYPTLVIKNTPLEKMYLEGKFAPLNLDEAVSYTAFAVRLFEKKNIAIIRMGLHSSSLSNNDSIVAGPYHPAFGELVIQKLFLEKAAEMISSEYTENYKRLTITVAKGGISRMVGQNRKNIKELKDRFRLEIKVVEDPDRDVKDDKISDPYIKLIFE